MNKKAIIGILLGDAAGVGPEIIAKCADKGFYEEYCRPVLIGDTRVFDRACQVVGADVKLQVIDKVEDANWDEGLPFLDLKDVDPAKAPFGQLSVESGKSCLDQLKLGIELYQEEKIDGFSFGPFNKAGLIQAGCEFESEHHYMAHLLNHTGPFGEINVLGNLWTTRTTSHIPISKVSESLSVDRIMRAITLANTSLKNAGMEKPRLAVAALNPHCGEEGRCGREEIDIIKPAVEKAVSQGMDVKGPYSADILFIRAFEGEFDAAITMYHDQGQIALKLKGFDHGITIAGGLPVPVVTCAHGTAYDIAGKGIVKTTAFENAVKMASKMGAHVRGY